MPESIQYAIQIYFMAFCIAIIIAAVIKGLLIVIRHLAPRKHHHVVEE
ncbi:MAG: hypothetical protein RR131_05095 [Anaerovorax sp.]